MAKLPLPILNWYYLPYRPPHTQTHVLFLKTPLFLSTSTKQLFIVTVSCQWNTKNFLYTDHSYILTSWLTEKATYKFVLKAQEYLLHLYRCDEKSSQNQLKQGSRLLGSQFQGISVHHTREGMVEQRCLWQQEHHISLNKETETVLELEASI